MAGKNVRVELARLARVPDNAVLAEFRVDSYTESSFSLQFLYNIDGVLRGKWLSPSIAVPEEHQRYLPLINASNGKCMCTRRSTWFEKGKTATFYAYFPAPPSKINRVTVQFPYTPIFSDVPVGDSASSADVPTPRPSAVETNTTTAKLVSRVFDTDGSSDTRRSGNQTRVRLSANVLFGFDKATLRPKARQELRDVARTIKRDSPEKVLVDGYTDSRGGPQVNKPLSKNRARSVKQALSKLVSNSDVTFVARGHGSNNPIASNDTKKGRQQNRRVTIRYKQ